jgi:DNA-binding CsgD family transcriptional regulator
MADRGWPPRRRLGRLRQPLTTDGARENRAALIGREREGAGLDALLDRVGDRGHAVVVRGEAGVGKSALLEDTRLAAVERGMATLAAGGAQSEAELPYSALHILLQPVLSASRQLPGPQHAALRAAFGIEKAPAPEPLLMCLAALELLSKTAAVAPLLVLIDDAQWLDDQTADVLTFVARRVEAEPIVMLFALRDSFPTRVEQAALTELHVSPLNAAASASVLDANTPELGPAIRRRVLAEALGNPLALRELPRAVGAGVDLSSAAPLPLTERLERAFAAGVPAVPKAARPLLLVAALDRTGNAQRIAAAAAALAGRPVGRAEFSAVLDTGVMTMAQNVIRFSHPLVRSAVYYAALPLELEAAHAALAAVYADDPLWSSWHKAALLSGPHDLLSAALEKAAGEALRRGASTAASLAFERAGELTTDDQRRVRLLARTAKLDFALGRGDVDARRLRQALRSDLSPADRALFSVIAGSVRDPNWDRPTKVRAAVETADQARAKGDVEHALEALHSAAVACWWWNDDQEVRDLVVAAARRLPPSDDRAVVLCSLAHADPVKCGAAVARFLSRITPADLSDGAAAEHLSDSASKVWAFGTALEFTSVAIDDFRAQRQLGSLGRALLTEAWAAVHVSQPARATFAAEEAQRLLTEAGAAQLAAEAALARAVVAADTGDTGKLVALVTRAEEILLPRGDPALSIAQFARGRAAVANHRHADAYLEFRRMFDPADAAHHAYIRSWAVADLVEAAVLSGADLEEASRYVVEFDAIAVASAAPFIRAQVRYARALLAPDDEADGRFTGALRDCQQWPALRARILLAYGSWLRRHKRLVESRAPLRAAEQAAASLGFAPLAERARQELRAAGERLRWRAPGAQAELTRQELQIAQLAAAGLTNREIGQKLYLSHRTIGYHLHRIFPKLGVTTRAQLREALADRDAVADLP